MQLSEYYTMAQVADYFGISDTVLRYAIRKGYMTVEIFDGKKTVIHRSQLEKMKTRWKPRKNKVSRPPLKPGLYYTPRQAATLLGLPEHIIREAIRRNVIKSTFLDNKTIVHQDEVDRFRKYRRASSAQAKRDAQQKLLGLGFKYTRNPPPGTPRGRSRNPSPFRRGWSYKGKYYGLTAVEALHQWQRSNK